LPISQEIAMTKVQKPKAPPSFAALVQAYFAEYLTQQRALSPQTIAAHRDVSSLQVIERALGVPVKRFERPMFGYLSREEMLAVIGTPDETWVSKRDHVLFLLLYNTGARVSEITGITVGEVVLDDGAACVHLHGKGRKQRSVPLWRSTVKAVRAWLRLNPQFDAASPLLPNRSGHAMTRNNVHQRLALAVAAAATETNPDLAKRRISPHTIRHTTAMHLLQAGVDISVIALWLRHESPVTTHHYVEADLTMKERALARLHEPEAKIQRYRAPDSLIDFLKTL
jgi:site-specific recombinase XerD